MVLIDMKKVFIFITASALCAVALVSCATKKANTKPDEEQVVAISGSDIGRKDSGMLRYEGATPSEMLESALAQKDKESIISLLSHTFTLDYVTKNGKTIRQILKESGDSSLEMIADERIKIERRPEGTYY